MGANSGSTSGSGVAPGETRVFGGGGVSTWTRPVCTLGFVWTDGVAALGVVFVFADKPGLRYAIVRMQFEQAICLPLHNLGNVEKHERIVMPQKVLEICGVLIFASFGMLSGAFASPQQDDAEPAETQIYQCTMNWSADSIECKARKTNGPCTTKYQGNHSSEAEAKKRCEEISGVTLNSGVVSCDPCWTVMENQSPVERCKLACDVINRICISRCRPRNNKECMNRCNQDTGACYRDCEK